MAQIFITASGTFSVDSDGSDLVIECIAGGGAGAHAASNIGAGGGGGAYAKKTVSYTPNASVPVTVGAGGTTTGGNGNAGGDTNWNSGVVIAKGGGGGTSSGGGTGGQAASCTPTTGAFSGGDGGGLGSNSRAGAGGGGAAGPNGAGKNGGVGGAASIYNGAGGGGAGGGSATDGGASSGSDPSGAGGTAQDGTAGGAGVSTNGANGNPGSHGSGGSGGAGNSGANSGSGGVGGDGVEYDSTHGAGGGGGGGAGGNGGTAGSGAAGGSYGGGGGGAGWSDGAGGAGAPGLIIVTYTPAPEDITLDPATGSLALTGATPTVALSGTISLSPATASVIITGVTPTVTLGGTTTLIPDAAALVITPGTPVVTLHIDLAPATAQLRIVPGAPGVSIVQTASSGSEDLVIGGSVVNWRESTFRLTRSTSQPDKASFGYRYQGGTRWPKYTEVSKFVNGVKRFGGFIENLEETAVEAHDDESSMVVRCTGYSNLMDWCVVNKLYPKSLIGGIVSIILYDLWKEHLAILGVSYRYERDGDPSVTLGDTLFKTITVTECCKLLLKSCPGWAIWIDQFKELRFKKVVDRGSADAPFSIFDGSNNWDRLTINTTPAPIINRQFVLPAKDIFGLFREDPITTDGTNFSYNTTYSLFAKPLVYLNDVLQIVGAIGSLPSDWQVSYVPQGVGVFFRSIPPSGRTVRIEYISPFPLTVKVEDAASIAAIGPREAAYHAKDVTTLDQAEALAAGLLARKLPDTQVGRLEWNEENNPDWLEPADSISIEKTIPLASGFYGVEQVESAEQADTTWRHAATVRQGPQSGTGADNVDEMMVVTRSQLNTIPFRVTIELDELGIELGESLRTFRMPTVLGGVFIHSWDGRFPFRPPTGTDAIIDVEIEDNPGSGVFVSIFPALTKPTFPAGSTSEQIGFEFADPDRKFVGGEMGRINVLQTGTVDDPGTAGVMHLNLS